MKIRFKDFVNENNRKKYPDSINRHNEKYAKALITSDGIYYVNFEEGDPNVSTLLFDLNLNLLSDNYFASDQLIKDIKENNYDWASEEMKYNIEEIKKEGN